MQSFSKGCVCSPMQLAARGALPDGCGVPGLWVFEPWMFAEHSPPGTSFPPGIDHETWTDMGLDPWRSEAHLNTLLASRSTSLPMCREYFEAHWSAYFVAREVTEFLRGAGVTVVLLPVPWHMFSPPQELGFEQKEGFVADPFSLEPCAFARCRVFTKPLP